MGSGVIYKERVDSFFKRNYGVDNEISPKCEITFGRERSEIKPQVDIFYLDKKPAEVNEGLLGRVVEDKSSSLQLRNIIHKYKDSSVNGFDAILFYKVDNQSVYFYGLSSIDKSSGIVKYSISTSDITNEEKLGGALCNVLSKLPTPAP
ncbi:hypothetical protein BMI79_15460 [Serratia oryzae]|uniref:Uncharacterized protein n=2 Tax=Serratia oryzae TaxID=2034155 RepID=A0A1S8CI55_9GAMM|nr:hypothetical protein BMI79_15460 [Serratia oryzae]